MTTLATATMQRLRRVGKPAKNKPAKVEPDGDPLPVQFNPASLKISRSNNVDRGGVTAKTQKVQNPSSEPAKLTFDLEFDTAEQTEGEEPVDVRRWTALVRQFVEPPTDPKHAGEPASAVQFAWGTLVFNGIVEQVTEDLDFFAPNGTPLHAKVSLSISEQNFAYEAKAGAAARDDKAATEPGGRTPSRNPAQSPPGTTPGSKGTSDPRSVAEAVEGESAQQLLSRMGLDPEAWRGAMSGLDSPLALAAGTQVRLGVEVEAGSSIGVSAQFAAGISAGDPVGLAASLGVGAAEPSVEAGFLLAANGGARAATDRLDAARGAAAAQESRTSFATGPARTGAVGVGPEPGSRQVPRPDPRALTFGWGVPLQSRGAARTLADAAVAGQVAISARARHAELPPAGGATPPWERLPPAAGPTSADAERRAGDAVGARFRRRPGGGCP